MSLTPKERADRRASFRKMSLAKKAEYICEYYWRPIVVGLAALLFVGSTVYRQFTKKEVLLYSALINLSVGDEMESQLNEGFVLVSGADPKKAEVYLYEGLYLSDDPSLENHEYQYASKLKLMASIEAKQLDIVLMNKEAYDIYSQNGYLLDFQDLLSSNDSLYRALEPHLTTNTVILEDNAIEYALQEATRYHAVTEEATNGLDVTAFPMFQEADLSGSVYLGVIRNSPRVPAVIQYIEYLASAQNEEAPTAD